MKTSEVSQGGTLKTSELLRKAADEIRRRGWFQGSYGEIDWKKEPSDDQRKTCRVCALGAVHAVVQDGDPFYSGYTESDPVDRANSALRSTVQYGNVPDWNDTPGRTVEEVLQKFEEAARTAEVSGD